MFDIGFSELFLCFVVALIVLGPERLPKVARTVGRFTGQARAYMRNLSAELERESHASELRKQFEEANQSAKDQMRALKHSVESTANDVSKVIKPDQDAP